MGVRDRLAVWMFARPRVLLVSAPDRPELRRRVESELDRRHWSLALAPADADVLLEVGTLGPDLRAAADVLWDQMPMPRVRRTLPDGGGDCGELLDRLAHDLAASLDRPEDGGPGSGPAAPPEQTASGHGDGAEGHDHHDHGGDVAGLPMAGTERDRDGLELDALEVDLGPVLPGWPSGLIVHGRLQGDVLTAVEVRTCSHASAVAADPSALDPVEAMDVLAGLLLVAGWTTAARDARVARAAWAAGRTDAERLVHGVTRRVRRSRSLRWSLRGLGVAPASAPWPPALRGDVWDRLLRWCDAAEGVGAWDEASTPAVLGPVVWAEMLEGAELAAVRLVVASLGPGLTPRRERVDRAAVVTDG